jgi:hypothetical protein
VTALSRASLAQQTATAPAAIGPITCSADSVTPVLAPRTPLASEAATRGVTRFSFIAYGDTRGRHDGTQLQAEHQLVVESMLATIQRRASTPDPIRFVLQSGDAVTRGADATKWNVSYVPLINRLTQDGDVPYFFSVGNHDVAGGRETGMCNTFAANRNLLPPEGSPHRMRGWPTYGFGYGNTWFLAFDSNVADDTTQLAWVRSELEKLDRRRYPNVVAFYHHPAFSSGPHGGAVVERQSAALRALWHPMFRKHHVRLLLAGHEHLFEHFVERWTDAQGSWRMDQIVSGGGGAPLYGWQGEPALGAYVRADSAARISVEHLVRPGIEPGLNPYHFLVVTIDGARVSVEVVGVDWGRGFAPYRTARTALDEPTRVP